MKPSMERIFVNYERLERLTKGKELTSETVADALHKLCPTVSIENLLDACKRMQNGIKTFNDFYSRYGDSDVESIAAEVIDKALEEKSETERKGALLQLFEYFRAADAVNTSEAKTVEAPDLAAMPEYMLRKILAEQMGNTTNALLYGASVNSADYEWDADIPPLDIPLLMAAAEYTSVLQGDLPVKYAEPPEMLGAGAAAYQKIVYGVGESEESKQFDVKKLLIGIALILIGVALFFLMANVFASAADVVAVKFILGEWSYEVFHFLNMLIGLACAIPVVAAFVKGGQTLFEEIKTIVVAFYRKLREKYSSKEASNVSESFNSEGSESKSREAVHAPAHDLEGDFEAPPQIV